MRPIYKYNETKFMLEGHFDDVRKCSAATAMIHLVMNIENNNDNLLDFTKEKNKPSMILVKKESTAFKCLKQAFDEWVQEYPSELRKGRLFDN